MLSKTERQVHDRKEVIGDREYRAVKENYTACGRDRGMIPNLDFRFHFVGDEVKLSDQKFLWRNRRTKVREGKITKFETKDSRQRVGQPPIAPGWNINSRFKVIQFLSRNGLENI